MKDSPINVINFINPGHSPLLDLEFSIAEMTVIRFSGGPERVRNFFRRLHKKKRPLFHEWLTDYLRTVNE